MAFTMQPAEREDTLPRVVILFVGKREPRHRRSDAWTILHDLFGVENPPENHHKQPCCAATLPVLAEHELDGPVFLTEVVVDLDGHGLVVEAISSVLARS